MSFLPSLVCQRKLPTLWEHPEAFPELQAYSPQWAPPKTPKPVEAATPVPNGYRWVKAEWVKDKEEFHNVNGIAIPVICWRDFK